MSRRNCVFTLQKSRRSPDCKSFLSFFNNIGHTLLCYKSFIYKRKSGDGKSKSTGYWILYPPGFENEFLFDDSFSLCAGISVKGEWQKDVTDLN